MVLKILYPDAQFDGPATIESEVFGSRAMLAVYRPDDSDAIPAELWQSCDGIICYHDVAIGPELIARLARCRIIVRAGVGFDQISIEECARFGIPVCNAP